MQGLAERLLGCSRLALSSPFITAAIMILVLFASINAFASEVLFQTQVPYSTGNAPYGLTVGDLDGDGSPDLIVPNNLDNDVSVLFGSSDGTFMPKVDYPAGLQPIRSLVTDLDRDSHPDVAVANHCGGGSCNIYVYMGSEDGVLETPAIHATENGPYDLIAGDFNRDGSQDIVVANGYSNTISFYAGNSSGDLQPQVSSPSGGFSIGMTQGDFNEDGILDLATSNHVDNSVSVILGSGDGRFPTLSVISIGGSRPSAIATTDINKDENTDLVVSSSIDDTAYTLLGSGDGTFGKYVGYMAGGTYPNDVMAVDMNGDTRIDIVTANWTSDNLSLLVQNAGGTFDSAQILNTGINPIALDISDFNGDALPDIAVANYSSDTISILLQGNPDSVPPGTNLLTGPTGTISTRDATFTWTGSDDVTASGDLVFSYMLVSSDVGWSTNDSTKTKTYLGLANGTYIFKVRAKDQAGNVDATPAEKAFTVNVPTKTRYEETSGQIVYKASCWSNYANAALSAGNAKISKKKSCTATFSYTGSKVDFISAKAKQLGKTKIYIDNVLQTTLDLYSSSTLAQQAVYTKTHGSSGAHTIKVEVLATKNTKATGYFVPIDAFDVTN